MTHNLSEPDNGERDPFVQSSAALLQPPERSAAYSLNVLLGIGVLGALLISIWVFGGFTPNRQTQLLSSPRGFDFRLFSTMSLLFQGKMIALISIAFGAGMILFLQKPNVPGKPTRADLFIRRQFWLIVLGVLNGIIFLWSEDILFHLGVMGILLFVFFRLSKRVLLVASLFTALIFSAKHFWNYSDDKGARKKYLAVLGVEKRIKQDSIARAAKKDTINNAKAVVKTDTLTKEQKKDKQAWEGIVKSMKYDAKKDEGSIKAMRKHNFEKVYDHLLPITQTREAQWTYRMGIWDLASMMFLGMALVGYGFFSSRLSSAKYFMIAIAAITVGLLLGWYRFYFQIEAIRDYEKYVIRHAMPYNMFFPFEQAFMALGYASGVMGIIRAGILKWLLKAFSSVGKLFITNYLLQSIFCTLFFTGVGMGYFARLHQFQLYLIVLEIWVVQVVCSVLWLRWFDEGPVEWLWRCLTYGKMLPVRRSGKSTPTLTSPIAS